MNAERLLALYERVAEAPDAIARLRRFVLDLAVRGKLVAQDAGDEPASELLKRIRAEKARLVHAGEIRKPKTFSILQESQNEIPLNWALVPLGEVILQHLGGGTPSKSNESYWNGDLRWASVKDVGKSKYLDDTIDRITDEGLANSSSNLIEPGNLLVVTRMGLGKVSINRIPVAINQDLRALFLSQCVSIDYAYNFFLTHGFEGTGLTVKGIKLEELLCIPFPLPPLAEQRRIVAKVEELMALLDRLEAARTAREATRGRLTAASLARLTAPDTDPAEFPANARFALDTLPALTARPDQIKALRQTILNLAVRGKLVEQDPADEPALVEKHRVEDEPPFDAPSGWQWVPFSAVAAFENGDRSKKYPKRAEYVASGVPWINTGHIEPDGTLSRSTMHFITEEKFASLGGGKIRPGDLVYCLRGATFGKTALVEPYERGAIASSLMIIRPGGQIDRRYAFIYLTSPLGREQLRRFDNGTAQPNLSSASVKRYQIPLPPLAEQHRIMAKVDALMALCDRLEAALTRADTGRARLLEALLHEALAPADVVMAAAE